MAFNFNASGTGTGGNLFGGATNTSAGGLFGQKAPATSGSENKPTFGSTAGATTPSTNAAPTFGGGLFGAAKPASSSTPTFSFGTQSTANAPSTTGTTPTTSTGGLFGGGTPAASGGVFGNAVAKPSPLGVQGTAQLSTNAGATPQKPADTTPSGGLFGNASKPSNLFGGAASTTPAGSTTPATKPTFSFGGSTTPAGPPPAKTDAATAPGAGLFGGGGGGGGSGLFGGGATKPAFGAAAPGSTPAAGGNFFGAKPAASDAKSTTPAAGGNLFGAKPALSDASGSTAAAAGNLFGAKPASSDSNAASGSAKPATSTPTFSFGTAKPATTEADKSSATAASTATATTTPSLFGGANAASSATKTGAIDKPADDKSTATPTAPSGGLFGAKPTTAPGIGSTAATTSINTGPTSTAGTSGTASGLFGSTAKPTNSTAALNAAASTAGPPPQLSRLKNKTLDEIIVRWSSDLSKYQKEFQDQAAKVASWDRLLVENGEQLQKLYVKTAESVRNTAEVEKQLSIVENQQAELESWLDKHEYEVDEMFNQTVIPGEGLQGPDQERERTYKLAEKLTERLDEMGKDLSSMIQEINTASASLSKTSKTDDPLSKIVRVLNGHLSQLQWIDQNAAQLQAKVAAVQKETQQLGSQTPGRYENDATDNLFRSYVGSRR